MYGAILGDIIGSPYEFDMGSKTKDFPLFSDKSHFTDDTVITIAVAEAFMGAPEDEGIIRQRLVAAMQKWGHRYPRAGYGLRFLDWLDCDDPQPYNSFGNGSAMRVSPCAWAVDSLEKVERLAKWSAEVTHDHPDAIKGAQAVAAAIFLARTGAQKAQIRQYIEEKYYDLRFTLDEIRPGYSFDVSCEGSVPQAIVSFLEAEDFADAIRNAISLGGDGDTQACIAGAIAEAYYGIPEELQEQVFDFVDETLQDYYGAYAHILYGA